MSPVSESVRIGILGDFNPEFRSHHATNDSLQHAARKLQLKVESAWLPTPSLLEPGAAATLDSFDGLWASPGSPYRSFDGMLKGIEFARVHDRPFLGTCGGFQYALIECARNVLGIHDATTAEEDPNAKNIVIYPVACAVPTKDPKAPKLSGKVKQIHLRPGSYLAAYYGKETITEEFFCNYEMNPEFEWMAMEAGFPIVARGANEECRAIESLAFLIRGEWGRAAPDDWRHLLYHRLCRLRAPGRYRQVPGRSHRQRPQLKIAAGCHRTVRRCRVQLVRDRFPIRLAAPARHHAVFLP